MIDPGIESQLHEFMRAELEKMDCRVKIINGMPDHVHCLFLLPTKYAVAEVIKQVKGSSSSFINKSNLLSETFGWQTGYAAFSVSNSVVPTVFKYIQNQKKHHLKQTFNDEYNDLTSSNS